jgi:hypothetical protein
MSRPLVHPLTKYIGPTVALQEVLYGLIMTLGTMSTVSITLGLSEATRDTMVLAAIGVNLTWGLADMVIYIVTKNFDRMRHRRLAEVLRADPDEEWPLEAIEDDLSETIVGNLDPADQERIYDDILDSGARVVGPYETKSSEHFLGGLSCLLLTMLAALPAAVILMFISPVTLGFRAATVASVVLLFVVGYQWAPYAGLRQGRTGVVMMAVGSLIALATVVLGG